MKTHSQIAACQGTYHKMPRRRFLQIGSLATLDFVLGGKAIASEGTNLVQPKSQIFSLNGEDKGLSLILIVLQGGLSHFDTFDPREDNVDPNIKGPFKRIETTATKVGGVYITEPLPMTAKQMHKILVVRNLFHNNSDHSRATCLLLTGSPEKAVSNDFYSDAKFNSPFITLSEHLTDIGSPDIGYVAFHHSEGRIRYTPQDFAEPKSTQLATQNEIQSVYPPDRKPYGGVHSEQLETIYIPCDFTKKEHTSPFSNQSNKIKYKERRKLLDKLNQQGQNISGDAVERFLKVDKKADSLLDGSFGDAMDLSKEASETRDRYGRNPFGNALLMGRRMVQAGARVVTANDGDYDQHEDIKPNLERLLSRFDKGYTALLEDIEKLNLPVVVAVVSEFGRTPNITRDKGREHWPNSFSMLLSGEGIEGGRFIGQVTNDGLIKRDAFDATLTGETLLHKIGFARYATRNGLITNEPMPYLPI